MPVIDVAIMRMALFELFERADVPTAVVLNEAVDLAKRFSTDDSGRFVNGVLAAIASEVRTE
jgi:N utilization substance protein B